MDKLIKGMLFQNMVNVTAISGKKMLEDAKCTHNLSRVCTAALGRVAMQCSMMSLSLKNDTDRLTVIFKGGGEAGSIVCTARPYGLVKGYVEYPQAEIPLYDDKLDVAMAVGWFGDMTVIRDMNMRDPYVGKTRLVSGEIAEDFANYYFLSEQKPTLIYLGERIDTQSGDVISAGGLMIEPLPNCPPDAIFKLEAFAKSVNVLPDMLKDDELSGVLYELFSGMDYVQTECIEPAFMCDCSRERLLQVLGTLSIDELKSMADEDKGAQMHCRFCNREYDFTEQELRDIISVLEEKNGNQD